MRRSRGRKLIGQMLIEKGHITDEQLEQALTAQEDSTQRIGEILMDLGFVEEKPLYETLAEQMRVEYVNLDEVKVDPGVAQLISQDTAKRHMALPVDRGEEGTIRVAMAEPTDVMALDDLKMRLQVEVEAMLAPADKIASVIDKVYAAAPAGEGGAAARPAATDFGMGDMQALAESVRDSGMLATEEELGEDHDRIETDRIADVADEAPIIRIAKILIQRAIQERASDIHAEPHGAGVRIRYRIDGVLHEILRLPKYVHAPLISRLKIMANMNIAERRVPQDGRIHVRHAGEDYDLRVSTIPTTMGEKCVMRILDKRAIMMGLENLGFSSSMLAQTETLIRQPNGMILSTGPTGSGKTTTQYSILNRINSVESNIITIEDPVEYQIDGISQVHVNRKAGLTFAIALKYFLRQDPDIILVGEIRDLETSEIAIQAALTGHLVLSTLHTNDAPSTVTRMIDMGVEPFLISSSVIASISQRLARRLCEDCREPYEPPRDQLLGLGFDPDDPANEDVTFYRGTGCPACRNTGYRGRIAVFELMVMTQEIRELVVKRASADQVKEAALAGGMVTLVDDAMDKAISGITDVDEIMRVVSTVR
ncbi:MAG: ATPase, T2SS/T4P/T4SS family [Armatimonadota bacterium]|nr:ATPase, T2SS/T4P/T4SS family [Armatimonadota bacterium]